MKSKKQRAQERLALEEKIRREQLEKLFSPKTREIYKKDDMVGLKKLLFILSASYPIETPIDYKISGIYTYSFNNGSKLKGNGTIKNKPAYCREHNVRDKEYIKTQNHIKQNGTGAVIIDGEFYNKKDLSQKLTFEQCDYIIIKDESLEEAYEKNFAAAIEKYNEKQKRKDRRINGIKAYMNKIRLDPQRRLIYEAVLQIGNKNIKMPDQKKGFSIMIEYIADWQTRNPDLYMVGAYYHRDEEGEAHIHIDYIPISRNRYARFEELKKEGKLPVGDNRKLQTRVNGLDVENSLSEALDHMGYKNCLMDPENIETCFGFCIREKKFKDPSRQKSYDDFLSSRTGKNGKPIKTRLVTRQMQWEQHERMKFKELCQKYGLTIENPADHAREHMDTPAYKLWKENENARKKTMEAERNLSAVLALGKSNEEEKKSINEQKINLKEEQQNIEFLKEQIELELDSIEKNKNILGSEYIQLERKKSDLQQKEYLITKEKKKYDNWDILFHEEAGKTAENITAKVIENFKQLSSANRNIESLKNIIQKNIENLSSDTLKTAYGYSKEITRIFGMNPTKIKTRDDIDTCLQNLITFAKKMKNAKTTSIQDYLRQKAKSEHNRETFGLSD